MGNRLKYRVWSTEQKKMYDWSDCIKKGPNFIYGMFIDHRMLGKGCWCIQQCTGLRDKNGKLVYFDDLVKNKWGQICKVIMQTDKQNYGRVVLQNIKYLNDEAHKNNIFIPAAINESVIIGNIYENPELLEENNAQKIM